MRKRTTDIRSDHKLPNTLLNTREHLHEYFIAVLIKHSICSSSLFAPRFLIDSYKTSLYELLQASRSTNHIGLRFTSQLHTPNICLTAITMCTQDINRYACTHESIILIPHKQRSSFFDSSLCPPLEVSKSDRTLGCGKCDWEEEEEK
jgi:hypothetical protein